MRYRIFCLGAVSLALLCTSPVEAGYGVGDPVAERTQGELPDIDEEASAVQGEPIYAKFDYVKQAGAELTEDLRMNRKQDFKSGHTFRAFRDGKKLRYCVLGKHTGLGISSPGFVCLVPDAEGKKLVKRYSLAKGALVGRSKKLKKPVSFKPVQVKLSRELAETLGASDFYHKEIVYQGAASGVLRLLYREYVDDLAREAFSQELTYDYNPDDPEPLEIAVKGARITVLSAGNSGIKYKVRRGFQ